MQFFRKLGILDVQKGIFLASLLRAFRDAASRLDTHLVPFGASVHAAVSRMYAADNPNDLPQHRWIRVMDRSGFFTDSDDHARRVINIGLSYAYRHMELDALAADHAVLLREYRMKGSMSAGEGGALQVATPASLMPNGGVTVADRAASTAPDAGGHAAQPRGDGSAAPGAGVSTGGAAGSSNGGGPAAGAVPDPGEGASGIPSGGMVVRRRGAAKDQDDGGTLKAATSIAQDNTHTSTGAVVNEMAAGDVDKPSSLQKINAEGAGDSDGDDIHTAVRVNSNVYATQPMIKPTTSAVAAVCAVLESLKDFEDVQVHLWDIMEKSLLCLARAAPGTAAQPSLGVFSATADGTWKGVATILSKWWPVWKAAVGAPMGLPPDGTLTSVRNAGRTARSSPWMVIVDMVDINPTLQRLAADSTRYFPKGELPLTTTVKRVAAGSRAPLMEVVASLLLVATNETSFCPILEDLASSGRSTARRNGPLLAAACHSFVSSGLSGTSAAPTPAPGRVGSTPPAVPPAAGTTTAKAPVGPSSGAADKAYVEMDALLRQERLVQSAAERQVRTAHRRLARASPSGSAARPRLAEVAVARAVPPADMGPIKQVERPGSAVVTASVPAPRQQSRPASFSPPAPLPVPAPAPSPTSPPGSTSARPPFSPSSLPPLPPMGSQLPPLTAGPSSLPPIPSSLPHLPALWPSMQSQPSPSPSPADARWCPYSQVPSQAPWTPTVAAAPLLPSTNGDEPSATPPSPDQSSRTKRLRTNAHGGAGT